MSPRIHLPFVTHSTAVLLQHFSLSWKSQCPPLPYFFWSFYWLPYSWILFCSSFSYLLPLPLVHIVNVDVFILFLLHNLVHSLSRYKQVLITLLYICQWGHIDFLSSKLFPELYTQIANFHFVNLAWISPKHCISISRRIRCAIYRQTCYFFCISYFLFMEMRLVLLAEGIFKFSFISVFYS